MPRYQTSSSAVVEVLESTVTSELDWELLYDLYAGRLRRIIQRKVGPALTEDVLQETFLRAFRNRHTLDPARPIAPWLITIALRAATDVQRRQLRTVDADMVEEPCEENGFGAVEEELLRRARRLGIKHALASLNTKQRRMLEAVAVEGVPYEQLARSEAMSPDAVKSALARARTNFRSSYFGFTRSTDLFGGLVGAAIWRLRTRLQRYQALVGEHAGAFGAATITVVAVGVVAYPAARPVPTHAEELSPVMMNVATQVGSSTLATADSLPTTNGVDVAGGAETARTAPAGSKESVRAGVQVSNQTSLQDHGTTFKGEAATHVNTPAGNVRNFHGYEVNCARGRVNAMECKVIDTLPNL